MEGMSGKDVVTPHHQPGDTTKHLNDKTLMRGHTAKLNTQLRLLSSNLLLFDHKSVDLVTWNSSLFHPLGVHDGIKNVLVPLNHSLSSPQSVS
jgi:hypothetical protein